MHSTEASFEKEQWAEVWREAVTAQTGSGRKEPGAEGVRPAAGC